MQTSTCPHCGAPLPAGASFCSFCGATVGSSTGAPLASAPNAPPPFPAPPPTPYAPASPPPRRSRARLVVVVILVVIVLFVAILAAAYFLFPAPPIQVSAIYVYAPDNVCGLGLPQNAIYYYGYNGSTGAAQTLEFEMPNYNATACTIVGAATNSSGFSLSNVQVPLTIPGNGDSTMNITITSPTSSYSGSMNLVLS